MNIPICVNQSKCKAMNNLVKLFTIAILLHLHFFRPATAQENCSDTTQFFINSSQVIVKPDDGSLELHGGFVYPPGFWKLENGNYAGCPCKIKICISHCSNLVSTSALSKRFIQQVIPSWHHYHHHGPDKITSHSENSLILIDNGNRTKEFFEIFYPIDEEMKADANYVQLPGPWSIQDIIEHRDAGICFVFKNQTLAIYQEHIEANDASSTTLAACMLVSVCSLTVLLVVFYVSNETKYLHGKSIACQSLCLMIAFTGLGLDYLSAFELETFECSFIGFVTYFSLISSFFWLNAMCFDMYWTFCYCTTGSNNAENKSKFRLYSYYAWICPLLMTIGVIYASVFVDDESIWSTGIGIWSCFIQGSSKEGPFVYLYGPLLVLLLLNFLFFFATLIKICHTQKELSRILRVGNTTQNKYENHRKFFMYLKLFAVMGGLWIMEFASWITDQNDGIWYFFDICNCLRGLWLLIFCVLLSKRVRVGVRRSLSMSMQHSDSKSSHNRNPTALTSTSIEKEQVEMHEITLPTASISSDEN